MALVKWTPMDVMDDFDRLWDDWMPVRVPRVMTPAVDVYEDKENVIVETPLTGIKPADVNIEIEENVLKISGKSEHQSEVDEKSYFRREIRSGAFFRSVALPRSVQGDKAEANYKDGVLKITIPKAEEAKPKKITVKAS